jgi:hypothetical protein
MERTPEQMLDRPPRDSVPGQSERRRFLTELAEPALQRELQHRGLLVTEGSFSAELLGWLEVA